jgi:hypothetical protein
MDNVKFIETEDAFGNKTINAIIDRGNGEFTSMTKAHYEELEAKETI